MILKLKRNTKINLFIIFLFLIIPIILYYDVFINIKYLTPGDGFNLYLPIKELYRKIIENGEFPLWNKYLANGTSYVGDIQNASFYILNFLFLLLPSVFSFNYFFIFHLSLAGIFTYLYLDVILKKKYIAFLGGVIFLLSPVLNVRKGHITVYSAVIWFPLLMYFVEKFFRSGKRKYLIFLSLAMSIQFLAGFPQITVYSDIFLGIYFIIMAINKKKSINEIIKNGLLIVGFYLGFISIQLLPLIELTKETGRVFIDYDYFISYSTPIKSIVMLFFPWIYGDQNGGDKFIGNILNNYSQVEMAFYIGIIPIIGALNSFFVKNNKNIYNSFFKFSFILTMLYSMLGEIPFLAKFIYRIPILNSFRVPSRINFIFIFSTIVLFCLLLDYIFQYENAEEKIGKFIFFNGCMFFILLLVALIFDISSKVMSTNDNIRDLYKINSKIYIITFGILILNIIIFKLYEKKIIKENWVILFLLLLISGDLYRVSIPFGKSYNPNSYGSILQNIEIGDYKVVKINKIWDDFNNDKSGVSPNNNILNNVSTIGGYITFMDKNYSKLTGYNDLKILQSDKLIVRSDILAMLSVKYIVQNRNADTVLDKGFDFKKLINIYENKNIILSSKYTKTPELTVIEIPLAFEKNKLYKIEFITKSLQNKERLVVDLYGGEIYDFPEQELFFDIEGISQKYSDFIYTGNKLPDNQVVIRFIRYGKSPIEISDFKLYEVGIKDEKSYNLLKETEDYKVYVNKEVKPILYKPEKIINQKVLFESLDYDFSENAYIEGIENMNLENVETKISDTNFKFNSINGVTESSDESFIVFSQSFYPGWRAYIDGEKTKLYKVNGVLQGIKVPKGKHKIEIKYRPNSLIYGVIISFLASILGICFCLKKEKKKK